MSGRAGRRRAGMVLDQVLICLYTQPVAPGQVWPRGEVRAPWYSRQIGHIDASTGRLLGTVGWPDGIADRPLYAAAVDYAGRVRGLWSIEVGRPRSGGATA